MMSEEEKKALENLKDILSALEDTEDGAIINLNQEKIDSLKAIPKLIEKQQHEIEGNEVLIDVLKHNDKVWNELYHKQEKELKKIEDLNIPVDTLIAEFKRLENIEDDRDCNYISKDKIRDKIKELEETIKKKRQLNIKEWVGFEKNEIEILEELLEE